MSFLEKIVGSDRALDGPKFGLAPEVCVNLSGNTVKFVDPPHTAMFPIKAYPENFDIYDNENFRQLEGGIFAKCCYVKGWDLKGRYGKARGGVRVGLYLNRYTNLSNEQSIFNRSVFEEIVLEYCHSVWGIQNDGAKLGSLGNGAFVYPTSKAEINYQEVGGTNFCRIEVSCKGKPPRLCFAAPFSSEHVMYIDFRLFAYNGLDFYSPETNLEDASLKVVDEFLNNFQLALKQ